MRIVWDEPKRLTNLAKRGLDFAQLDIGFVAASTVVAAKSGRFMAIGWFDGMMISVVFRVLGNEAISVISMRHASRKERAIYAEAR